LGFSILGLRCLFPSAEAAGQSGRVSSTECCLELLFPLGARAVSLGQSLTARTSPDGIFYNPASLANTGRDQFLLHHETTFEGQNNAFMVLVDAGLAGAFGLTYALIDQGEEDATGQSGEITGRLTIRQQQLLATYATPVRVGLRAGVSYKLFHGGTYCAGSCAGNEKTGTTHLLDLGAQYTPRFFPHLELGASITQFGFALQQKNAEQADPTPARLRVGAAYEVAHHFRADSTVSVWLSGDVVNRLRSPTAPVIGVGVEVAFDRTIFVRAGYSGSGDALTKGGGGLGIGIRYERFTVDVATLFTRSELDTEGTPFQVSFGITF
jgi:hypothetical protein